jgi:hypothetical protein
MKKISLLLITLFLFSGCAANKILSSYSDKDVEQYKLGRILVVGIAKNETKRRIYENTFTESFTKKGVQSVPSYSVAKQSIEPSKAALMDAIAKSSADTVLITHMLGQSEQEFYQPGTRFFYNGNAYNGLFDYYPFVYNTISTPGSYTNTTKVILETNIYDVKSEKLLWSARTESIDPVMTKKYYQKLIDLFLSDLQKNDLLN